MKRNVASALERTQRRRIISSHCPDETFAFQCAYRQASHRLLSARFLFFRVLLHDSNLARASPSETHFARLADLAQPSAIQLRLQTADYERSVRSARQKVMPYLVACGIFANHGYKF
jgi:hypothetical protein